MSFIAVLLVVLAGVLVICILTALTLASVSRSDTPKVGARRRIQVLYLIAALLGLIFAIVILYLGPTVYINSTEVPGLLASLGPIMAGLVFVDVAALGEAFWPKPKGVSRGAYLTRRPPLINGATVPVWSMGTWALLLTGFLIFTGFSATRSGESAGRSLPHHVGEGSSGPFPGWPYGVPILILGLVLILFVLLILHQIARRPAVFGTSPSEDLYLRRMSATYLTKGAQLAFAVTLAGLLFFAGSAATNAGWWWGVPAMVSAAPILLTSIGVVFWKSR